MSKPPAPGVFTRAELMTVDAVAAAAFYERVAGFQAEPDLQPGGGRAYTAYTWLKRRLAGAADLSPLSRPFSDKIFYNKIN